MIYQHKTHAYNVGVPQSHESLCKVKCENGDFLRHLEQLWDEVQKLKREIRELKKSKNEG
jgi:hypothetical protein